jgi:methionyl-tRNA synthetase
VEWRNIPGPRVVGESFLQVMCSGCDRSLKSGTRCDTCGRWFHNSCGNVKLNWQTVGSGTVKDVNGKIVPTRGET